MKREIKGFLMALGVMVLMVAIATFSDYARGAGGFAAGPAITTNADVAVPSGSQTQVLAASTPVSGAQVTNRICAEIDWVSGSPVRCGDSAITASRGVPIAAATGAGKTFCADSAIWCWGAGGTAVVAPNELTRQ